jgi:hypothetical protein
MLKTKERMEIVARLYSTNILNDDLLAAINATEGGLVRMDNVRHWGKQLGLERDREAVERQRSVSARSANARAKETEAAVLARQEIPIPYTPDWPYERVQKLIELWRAGHQKGECALQLGCTRNAVTGKVDRLVARGILESRGNPLNLMRRVRSEPIPERVRKVVALPSLAPVAPKPVREPAAFIPRPVIVDFRSHAPLRVARVKAEVVIGKSPCRFPLWAHDEAPTHRFCDKPAVLGASWCPDCRRIVFGKGVAAA